ncbi:hypothetical protein HMPREF0762_01801 [Slackia exigua ATCC 700122]|uniref:Uncharacterized protein n=1 Tax=Slackia exigua (strain ATCC 700122 / DSM 15923 / CIP 105133 / JCM 11022 / KCTC 5966 / S-7) TaxID=649764 RepID=D0WIX6_SLAES|nr:hypothetical protein HMPREF0762_01801 [Slackia exigua ATCC 700122]
MHMYVDTTHGLQIISKQLDVSALVYDIHAHKIIHGTVLFYCIFLCFVLGKRGYPFAYRMFDARIECVVLFASKVFDQPDAPYGAFVPSFRRRLASTAGLLY